MSWWGYLLIALGFLLFNFLLNFYRLSRVSKIKTLYTSWLMDGEDDEFLEHTQELISLFKKANLSDAEIASTIPTGYMQLASASVSVFRNMISRDSRIVYSIFNMFPQAIGVYKHRIFNSFNPLSWIEFVVFFPRHIASYLNLKTESVITKLFQLIWWLVTPLAIIFREKLLALFASLF